MDFILTSTAFESGRAIPRLYTAEGRNLSPPLKWSDPPKGTLSLALLLEDTGAEEDGSACWIAFNVPVVSRELEEGVPLLANFPNGMLQGTNGRGRLGYTGPAPPQGQERLYQFRLFALDQPLTLAGGARREPFLRALNQHVIAEAALACTYQAGRGRQRPDDLLRKKALQDWMALTTLPFADEPMPAGRART